MVEKGNENAGDEQTQEVNVNVPNSQEVRVDEDEEHPQDDQVTLEQNGENEETTPTPTQEEQYKVPENLREVPSHPLSNVIGNPTEGVMTRSKHHSSIAHCAFVSQIEPKNLKKTNIEPSWISAMQEELLQFERNNVWEVVPRPENRKIIGTK